MSEKTFESWITEEIRAFVRGDAGNRLEGLDGSPIFEEPLVGFASGTDPIFRRLKEVIGEFHLSPPQALSAVAETRGVPAPPPERTGVISYVLPIARETRRENRGVPCEAGLPATQSLSDE